MSNARRNRAINMEASPQEVTIFKLLKGGEAIKIERLFAEVNETPGIYDRRMMQMRLGGIISRLNKRLNAFGQKAVAGEPPGTYRIREFLL
jgi:hypothetical protein